MLQETEAWSTVCGAYQTKASVCNANHMASEKEKKSGSKITMIIYYYFLLVLE